MAGLDSRYIVTSDLESYFVDKDDGTPLAGGIVTFYADNNRSVLKPVYELTGNANSYSYNPLPNPCILSGVGTFQDELGNNIVPYYFPYDQNGNLQLYYITVTDSLGVLQFTRSAWPNEAAGSSPSGNSNSINYIPNGQFIAHNDEEPTPTVYSIAGENVNYTPIAQGGWYFTQETGGSNVYDNSFIQILTYTPSLGDYPRYAFNFNCTANGNDDVRDLTITWKDVFTFATYSASPSTPLTYTLSFSARTLDTKTYVFSLRQISYYGTNGAPTTSTDLSTGYSATITPSFQTFVIQNIVFPQNTGTVGTNNDDFIALALRGPQSTFNVEFTDFSLLPGNVSPAYFPITTIAKQMDETTAGWLPIPSPNNLSLYLPVRLGSEGLIYDTSEVGTVVAKTYIGDFTNSISTTSNELLCNGNSYVMSAYSSLGIPYVRLFNKLYDSVNQIPIFGTGSNFVSAYNSAAATKRVIFNTNTAGAQTAPANGSFSPALTFNLQYTGTAGYLYNAHTNGSTLVTAVSTFDDTPLAAPGSSTFTITQYNGGYSVVGDYKCFTVTALSAAALTNTGGAGYYFNFSNDTTSYYMWFQPTNETNPNPMSGGTSIQVIIDPTYTAADVAKVIAAVLSGQQCYEIDFNSATLPIPQQSWFTFSAASSNYFVWYNVGGMASAPSASGIGIEVIVTNSETAQTMATKTVAAINSYQFAVPDLRGVFLRGLDPTGIWDIDHNNRWTLDNASSVNGIGSYEIDIFSTHAHTTTNYAATTGSATDRIGAGTTGSNTSGTTLASGGSENRPVNMFVAYAIKY